MDRKKAAAPVSLLRWSPFVADWNHQGVWAIGAAVAGGIFGIVGTSLSTGSSENLASLSYAERIKKSEIQIEQMELTLAGLRKEIEAQLSVLEAASSDATALDLLAKVGDLERQLKALEERPVGAATGPDVQEIAAALAQNHSEVLRGPQGPQGEPGAAGVDGLIDRGTGRRRGVEQQSA